MEGRLQYLSYLLYFWLGMADLEHVNPLFVSRSGRRRFILFTIAFAVLGTGGLTLPAQTVYHHINNTELYAFLDEMASARLIGVNSTVKPWTRMFIAGKLQELDGQREHLNPRQQRALDFYLRDFNKELKPDRNFDKRFDAYYYKDSLFTFSANIIMGVQYHTGTNGDAFFWYNGAEVFAYAGKHFGVYASLRDHHDKEYLVHEDYLTQRMGSANRKTGGDFEEMRGGITWSWEWGNIGLIMDHSAWGSGYNGTNIQSGRAPSIARINLQMKPASWFEFNYHHGWLVSGVVDSSRSYWINNLVGGDYRKVMHRKYMAANIFTFTPVGNLNVSFGNSVVYSDIGLHPGYLIPVFFYKAVDHAVNAGIDNMNSQMFLDISSRNIRNLHIYGTWFIDEVNTTNLFDPARHSNYFSVKLGGRLSNLPVQNLSLTGEWTRTNPNVFRHYVPTLTYESNLYNLGHYLEDNAREYYLAADYRPVRGLLVRLSWLNALKGPDHAELGSPRLGLPFLESVEWRNTTVELLASWQVINDGYVWARYRYSDISGDRLDRYTHPLYHGKTGTLTLGMNFGF